MTDATAVAASVEVARSAANKSIRFFASPGQGSPAGIHAGGYDIPAVHQQHSVSEFALSLRANSKSSQIALETAACPPTAS